MEIPRPLANLIDQAKTLSKGSSPSSFGLSVTIITPSAHYETLGVEAYIVDSDFQDERADVGNISVRLQPGLYQDKILPFKDNLIFELIQTSGLKAVSKRYRATPTEDGDNRVQGAHTSVVNMNNIDTQNFISVNFQLLEIGFDAIRNALVSGTFVSAKPDDVLSHLLTTGTQELGLTGSDVFLGTDIEKPIDNTKVYRQIVIKQGTRLNNLAEYMQTQQGIGIYSRGLGSFYRAGMWYVYPLVKAGRYGASKFNADIIRLPSDVLPTLDESYYTNGEAITLIATGQGAYVDNTDILRQNYGAGNQLINPSMASGETGMHYANGRAVKTRQDSLTEFKTKERSSGNERINMNAVPTANPFPHLSEASLRDVTILEFEWHNSNHFSIKPNMAIKYYYMNDQGSLTVREGSIIWMRSTMQPVTYGANLQFKSFSVVRVYLQPEEAKPVTPNA